MSRLQAGESQEPDTLDHALLYDSLNWRLTALEAFAEAMEQLCGDDQEPGV